MIQVAGLSGSWEGSVGLYFPMTLAVAKRIGDAVDKVRNGGKEVTALAYSYSQSAFAIAAHCDKILLDPMGQVNLRGIGMSSLYYKDLLNTLKVTPYIFKAGHFKSAVEPYTRNDMSPDVKAEYADLAANLWDEYINELNVRKVLSRSIVLPDAAKYVKELEFYKGDTALMQLENNLVDELISREDYLLSLCKDYGTDKNDATIPNMINYRKYLALKSIPEKLKDKRIAVIYGIGQISGFSNDEHVNTYCKLRDYIGTFDKNNRILYFPQEQDGILTLKLLQFSGSHIDVDLIENLANIDLNKYNIVILLDNIQFSTVFHNLNKITDGIYRGEGFSCVYNQINGNMFFNTASSIPYLSICTVTDNFWQKRNFRLLDVLVFSEKFDGYEHSFKYYIYENLNKPVIK